jgi:hypothetical protein
MGERKKRDVVEFTLTKKQEKERFCVFKCACV